MPFGLPKDEMERQIANFEGTAEVATPPPLEESPKPTAKKKPKTGK